MSTVSRHGYPENNTAEAYRPPNLNGGGDASAVEDRLHKSSATEYRLHKNSAINDRLHFISAVEGGP